MSIEPELHDFLSNNIQIVIIIPGVVKVGCKDIEQIPVQIVDDMYFLWQDLFTISL